MTKHRTFKITSPHMKGEDIENWQRTLNEQFEEWKVDYPLSVDGDYGPITRSATATARYGLGIADPDMDEGVTPELRIKIRNKQLTDADRKRHDDRQGWRVRLRKKYEGKDVSSPLGKILESSWGYQSGHDGVDLICNQRAAGLAICKGRIVRADSGGWWGKGAPSPEVAAKGDGIVILRCMIDAGPFRKGLNFCYGHAENPRVKVGDTVEAGQVICEAGLANAWHFHFMVNNRQDNRGVGDRDPMPFVDYALSQD